jgi:hypothetical protein
VAGPLDQNCLLATHVSVTSCLPAAVPHPVQHASVFPLPALLPCPDHSLWMYVQVRAYSHCCLDQQPHNIPHDQLATVRHSPDPQLGIEVGNQGVAG